MNKLLPWSRLTSAIDCALPPPAGHHDAVRLSFHMGRRYIENLTLHLHVGEFTKGALQNGKQCQSMTINVLQHILGHYPFNVDFKCSYTLVNIATLFRHQLGNSISNGAFMSLGIMGKSFSRRGKVLVNDAS